MMVMFNLLLITVCFLQSAKMSVLNQFYLLQYKNWRLQYRRKLVTALEIILPVAFCLLIAALRGLVKVKEFPNPTVFPSYEIDSFPPELVTSMNPAYIGLGYTPRTVVTSAIMNQVAGRLQNVDTGPAFILCEHQKSVCV